MKIKRGQKLRIDHRRKGTFTAIALQDFDSDEAEWFTVALAEGQVEGLNTNWVPGEEITCRASFAEIVKVL